MINLETSLKSIPKISKKYHKPLEKLGLFTVQDFLKYLPFRYDDFSKVAEPSNDYLGQTITILGKVIKAKNNRIFRRRMTVTDIRIQTQDGIQVKLIWFNQPYILENFPIGSDVRISGKLEMNGRIFTIKNPAIEKSNRDTTNTGCLVPIYGETTGITSRWIRWQMKNFLPLTKNIPEILPDYIRKKYNLYNIQEALCELHFPTSQEKMLIAQKRIAFQEMFLVQLKTLLIKKDWENKKSLKIKFNEKLVKDFVEKLPFKLTNAQRKSTFEILRDLEKPIPMNRLLNGDVGSGKTIVAGIATLQTISDKYQVAIMAPTEVLARQHFESFCKIFENYDMKIALLTNSYKLTNCHPKLVSGSQKMLKQVQYNKRENLLEKISSGKIDLVIGTHAIIQEDVSFRNLALIIIDEQHRFGVTQRAALQNKTMSISDGSKKSIPHLLTMTATPIPRTLAISLFGSLEISLLDEMPKNRLPIKTKVVRPEAQKDTHEFCKKEIEKGRQVFIIFPLVEESKSKMMAEVKAATKEYEKLKKVFPASKLGLMHGRLKSKEKEEIMKKFSDREFDILVSTSVVEVGIDIPNASVIIIENAERFGLSQLHQFRGRVGRGHHQSHCFLFVSNNFLNVNTNVLTSVPTLIPTRLKVMERTNDGFEIAEQDLKLRGPGQFFGTIQSGIPDIAMENLGNIKLVKFARSEAKEILETDPKLKKHPLLADALIKFSNKIHLE